MTFLKDSTQLLKNRGYKITNPRKAVLEVLSKTEIPLSAYNIEKKIPKRIPTNIVTVYRVLDIFEKLGIIHRIHTKEGYIRCDFKSAPGCHYFAVCSECGRTSEFLRKGPCLLRTIVPKNIPFKSLKHLTEISGICEHCVISKV